MMFICINLLVIDKGSNQLFIFHNNVYCSFLLSILNLTYIGLSGHPGIGFQYTNFFIFLYKGGI